MSECVIGRDNKRRRQYFRLISLLLAAIVVISSLVFLKPHKAYAYSQGDLLVQASEWNGVDVYYNVPGYVSNERTAYGIKWQCVELAQRFYFQVFSLLGPNDDPVWGVDASGMFDIAPSLGLGAYANGTPSAPAPRWGDILAFENHVALVTGVSNGRVHFVQQNYSWGDSPVARDSLPIDGNNYISNTGSESGASYPSVRGWIHHPYNYGPPPYQLQYKFSGKVKDNNGNGIATIYILSTDGLPGYGTTHYSRYAFTEGKREGEDPGYFELDVPSGTLYIGTLDPLSYSANKDEGWVKANITQDGTASPWYKYGEDTPAINITSNITGLDIRVQKGYWLSVRVIDQSGNDLDMGGPENYGIVCVNDGSGYRNDYYFGSGHGWCFLDYVPQGSKVKLYAQASGYSAEWYDNKKSRDEATEVVIDGRKEITLTLEQVSAPSGGGGGGSTINGNTSLVQVSTNVESIAPNKKASFEVTSYPEGTKRVLFLLDGKIKRTDKKPPFTANIKIKPGTHTITIITLDKNKNEIGRTEIQVNK